MPKIRYMDGLKYQLVDTYYHPTLIKGFSLGYDFIYLASDGTLTIYAGYSWDGASGPTWDSKSSMRGSLVHDALYQLMGISPDLLVYRAYADELLHDICKEDGMWGIRAWTWKKTVNWFGGSAAKTTDKVQEAP